MFDRIVGLELDCLQVSSSLQVSTVARKSRAVLGNLRTWGKIYGDGGEVNSKLMEAVLQGKSDGHNAIHITM